MNRASFEITVGSLMAEATTCSLATVDDQGQAHAANLNHVPLEKLTFAFISNPESAHAQHLVQRPQVAVTMYKPFESTREIQGLQMRGLCQMAEPEAFDGLWSKLVARFPEAAAQASRAKTQRFYRFIPRWIRCIDNRRGFGWRTESVWPPQA